MASGAQSRVNILVVDDVPAKLIAMDALLAELDENVVCVASGADALRQLLERDFALILLDVNMPDMDGFETAALIRRRPRLRHVPIIFMTAGHDDAHALRGYSLGAVDYVLTPVVPDVLRTKVRVFVEQFRMTEELKRQAEERVALAREQAGRAAAERASRRAAFLADAGKSMARSLDLETTVTTILDLVVPALGDHALLRLRVAGEETVHARHAGGGNRAAGSLGPRMSEAMDAAVGALGRQLVTRPGEPEPARGVACPLLARGAALGVFAVASQGPDKVYDPAMIELFEEICGRAAIAVDNCLLYREIEERDIRKEQFVAMLAHELRNPLGAISSAVGVLDLVGGDPADRARELIKRQLRNLSQLVEDLVDTTRITTGKISLTRSSVNLAEHAARSVRAFEVAGTANGYHISVNSQDTWIHADPARIDQILANLIGNALKYTPAGGSIAIRVNPEGNQGVIEITDTGVGMSSEVLAHAFELFYQDERASDRARGGLGVGLTLVRQLVELHGGSVEAVSDGEGLGSRFTLRFPSSSPAARADAETALDAADAGTFRILVVEDNEDARQMLQLLLTLGGHQVHAAADGVSGLEMAAATSPDIAVIDLGLPGMDGYEVARRLRASRAKDMGLIALSGYGQPEDRRKAVAAGFDTHVVKPVDPAHLSAVIASLQRRRREESDTSSPDPRTRAEG
jgi:CheY-like chemotaxis protein